MSAFRAVERALDSVLEGHARGIRGSDPIARSNRRSQSAIRRDDPVPASRPRVRGATRSPACRAGWRKSIASGLRGVARRAWQFFVSQSFSSLTRRIVSLNVAGLVALVVGILYLSQFRAGLIDARVESLVVQGEIIAGAIAASATADSYGTYIDRDRLLELQPGENYGDRRRHRARVLDQSGARRAGAAPADLADQDARPHLRPQRLSHPRQPQPLHSRRGDAPRPAAAERKKARTCSSAAGTRSASWLGYGDLPLYRELGADAGKDYPEVAQALLGAKSAYMVRVDDRGEVIVSVAVPVQRFRAVRGALLLSTQGGDINQAVEAERLQIVKLFVHPAGRHGGAVDPARRAPSPARSSGSPTAPSGCATASAPASKSPT